MANTSTYGRITAVLQAAGNNLEAPRSAKDVDAMLADKGSKQTAVLAVNAKATNAENSVLSAGNEVERVKRTLIDLIKSLPPRDEGTPVTEAENVLEEFRQAFNSSEEGYKLLQSEFESLDEKLQTTCRNFVEGTETDPAQLKQDTEATLKTMETLATNAKTVTGEMAAVQQGMEWFGNTYHFEVSEQMARQDRLDEVIPTQAQLPTLS